MDRTSALKHLPELYARALLLRDEGLDEETIAERLGIPAEAVGPALRVAELKLARVIGATPYGDGASQISREGQDVQIINSSE